MQISSGALGSNALGCFPVGFGYKDPKIQSVGLYLIALSIYPRYICPS